MPLTPPTATPPSSSKPFFGSRRPVVRVVAVAAVASLALSAAFLALSGHPGGDPAQREMATRTSALARLNSASLGPDPTVVVQQATGEAAQALDAAKQPLSAAMADATGQLDAAMKSSVLASLPVDYTPGMDISQDVKAVKAVAYQLPAFTGQVDVGAFRSAAVRVDASPVVARGLHAPGLGLDGADAVLAQVTAAYGTLQNALAALNASSLTGGLPVGGLPIVGTLPGVGTVPSQAQDANDAADPDEQGAGKAGGHAAALLTSVESAYALGQPSLAGLLAGYQGLATQVQDLLDQAQNTTDQSSALIQSQLADRITALQNGIDAAQKQAVALVAAQHAAIAAAGESAQAALQAAADEQVAAIQDAVKVDVQRLNDLAAQVPGQAEAMQQSIQSTVDGASANLSAIKGRDTSATLQAIQAAGAKALQAVAQDGVARAQALKAAASDLQVRGDAAVRQLQHAAQVGQALLQDTTAKALARLGDAQAYLVDLAHAQEAAAEAAENGAAQAALTQLDTLEKAYVAKVVKSSVALAGATDKPLHAVDELVSEVGSVTAAQVQKDIGYVSKVSSDYAKIPTSQRMERSTAWSTVAGAANGRLGQVLSTTDEMQALAGQVLAAAQAAKAEIEAMA